MKTLCRYLFLLPAWTYLAGVGNGCRTVPPAAAEGLVGWRVDELVSGWVGNSRTHQPANSPTRAENLAAGRPYLLSAAPLEAYYDDTGPEAYQAAFFRGELTDGQQGPAASRDPHSRLIPPCDVGAWGTSRTR
jgi:hypothetical protein